MNTLYPYLQDSTFLFNLAREKNQLLYIKIIVLTFDEKPIREVQGLVINGSINVDGNSAVRRTANMTVFLDDKDINYMEIGGIFSLNKKIKIEIGLANNTNNHYSEAYPILWFPQGIYCIMNLSTSHAINGTNISLQLKDKMVFLNGECGGTIPAATVFHEYDEINPETGEYVVQRPTIVQIIRELVNHFGQEQLNRILISDLDTRIKKVMKWNQSNPLYYYVDDLGGALLTLVPLSEADGRKYGRLGKLEAELEEVKNRRKLENSEYYSAAQWEQLQKDYDAEISKLETDIDIEKQLIQNSNSTSNESEWKVFKIFSYGQDVGYIYSDFYYPGELNGNAGDTVCSILDNIKNTLGNFEYFYDLNGNFRFQEIKNYLNTSLTTDILNNSNAEHYLTNRSKGKVKYEFNDSSIITSFSNSPQYGMIKNDFVVWGMRKTVENKTLPIRYHLAIDTKPVPGNQYQCQFFDDPESINLADLQPIKKAKMPITLDRIEQFPQIGELGKVYWVKDTERKIDQGYYWDPDNERTLTEAEKKIKQDGKIIFPHYLKEFPEEESTPDESFTKPSVERLFMDESFKYSVKPVDKNNDGKFDTYTVEYTHYYPAQLEKITTTDWRSELYMSGVNTTRFGTDSNYYYTELENEWTKLYDLKNQQWKQEIIDDVTSMDYFLDFIDSTAAISQFSIQNIGRRTKVVVDDKINCIFEPEIPDYVLIQQETDDSDALIQECLDRGQNFLQIESDIYDGLVLGGTYNSAYNYMQNLLYQHTGYNEAITLQILPMYFLEPNIRIGVWDKETGIHGDYMLNTFSIPLDISGTMTLSCTKALEKI